MPTLKTKWIPIPNTPLEMRYNGPEWIAKLLIHRRYFLTRVLAPVFSAHFEYRERI
jgi:hypothetical protein